MNSLLSIDDTSNTERTRRYGVSRATYIHISQSVCQRSELFAIFVYNKYKNQYNNKRASEWVVRDYTYNNSVAIIIIIMCPDEERVMVMMEGIGRKALQKLFLY